MPPKDDFNVQKAIKEVEEANDGIKFDEKIRESICRSVPVQEEVKKVVWILLKEKIIWLVLGMFSFVALELLKELLSKLIQKI